MDAPVEELGAPAGLLGPPGRLFQGTPFIPVSPSEQRPKRWLRATNVLVMP